MFLKKTLFQGKSVTDLQDFPGSLVGSAGRILAVSNSEENVDFVNMTWMSFIGEIVIKAREHTAPDAVGLLECDGVSVPGDSKYDNLRAFLNKGDPTNRTSGWDATVASPDLRGKFIVGKADAGTFQNLNASGGQETVDIQHAHSVDSHTHSLNSHTHTLSAHTHTMQSHTHSLSSHTHGDGSYATRTEWTSTSTDKVMIQGATTSSWGNTYTVGVAQSATGWYGATTGAVMVVGTSAGPSNNTSGGPSNNTTAGPSTDTSGASSGNTGSAGPNTGNNLSASQSVLPPYNVRKYYIRY